MLTREHCPRFGSHHLRNVADALWEAGDYLCACGFAVHLDGGHQEFKAPNVPVYLQRDREAFLAGISGRRL